MLIKISGMVLLIGTIIPFIFGTWILMDKRKWMRTHPSLKARVVEMPSVSSITKQMENVKN